MIILKNWFCVCLQIHDMSLQRDVDLDSLDDASLQAEVMLLMH